MTAITLTNGWGNYHLYINYVFCLLVTWSRDMVKTIVGKRCVVWWL